MIIRQMMPLRLLKTVLQGCRKSPRGGGIEIKIYRNSRNLGEGKNTNHLIQIANGKYILVLHDDDMLMPYALEHLYTVIEKYHADVVHGMARFDAKSSDISTISNKNIIPIIHDRIPVREITVIPNDPITRFKEFYYLGTFMDIQYNLFKKEFLIDNEIYFEQFAGRGIGGPTLLSLHWIMKSKIFVKTTVPFYIHRNAPDSTSSKILSHNDIEADLEKTIDRLFNISRYLDVLLQRMDFFKDNELYKDMAKWRIFLTSEDWAIHGSGFYRNGISPEIYRAVKNSLKKYCGNDYTYVAFLFHYIHELKCGRNPGEDFFHLSQLKDQNL